jgi:hypothetical protein
MNRFYAFTFSRWLEKSEVQAGFELRFTNQSKNKTANNLSINNLILNPVKNFTYQDKLYYNQTIEKSCKL